MKTALYALIIIFIFSSCSYFYSRIEKAEILAEEIISPTLPEGARYSKMDTYVDSAFSRLFLCSDVRNAALSILELREERDSLKYNSYILEGKIKILQSYIRKRNEEYKANEHCGWKITHFYNVKDSLKDTTYIVGLIADMDFEKLLLDKLITLDLSKEFRKINSVIEEACQN